METRSHNYFPKGSDCLGIILGIDIGGSTTKIVGLREDRSLLSTLQVKADDQLTSLYGALGNFLSSNRLVLQDIRRIVITGVGASYVEGDIYGIPTIRVNEFSAAGAGGLSLSGCSNAVVVSMGTGTAFIWAKENGDIQHLGGSGVGGGTLLGLCSQLVGTNHFDQIQKLSQDGDLHKVDLYVGDMSKEQVYPLPMDVTAANFGNISDDVSPADIALGVTNLVLQAIGSMAVFACRACQTDTVILTGALTHSSQCQSLFEAFTKLQGVRFLIPENATFATSIGAALYSMAQED